jgi:hypothetical protein
VLDREIRRQPGVSHEPLDQLAAVTQAEHEAVEALLGIDPHHVPEDGPAADLDERLRDRLGVLAQTGTRPA